MRDPPIFKGKRCTFDDGVDNNKFLVVYILFSNLKPKIPWRMSASTRGIIEYSSEDFGETFLSSRCFQAFFFIRVLLLLIYIGGYFGVLFQPIRRTIFFLRSLWYGYFLFILLCCALFSLLLGALTSIQQSSNSHQSTSILLMVFGIGLAVSSLGLSSVPIFFRMSENNNWACILIIICFLLIALTISGYTVSFFSLSIYFSDNKLFLHGHFLSGRLWVNLHLWELFPSPWAYLIPYFSYPLFLPLIAF